jgi:hypothetical protein
MQKRHIIVTLMFVTMFSLMAGFFYFLKYSNGRWQGIQNNSELVAESSHLGDFMFIKEEAYARRKTMGEGWVVWGTLKNSHTTDIASEITLKVNFTDGSTIHVLKREFLPDAASVFRINIEGHPNGVFQDVEIVGVR